MLVNPAQEARSKKLDSGSIFQQHWWLSVVTRDRFAEVTMDRGRDAVARMPYYLHKRRGWLFCEMPPFTRTLGPVLHERGLSSASQRSVLDLLIGQLPKVSVFRQVLHPSITDGIPFQARDYSLGLQYTYRIDCLRTPDLLWRALRDKTRNLIRRAQEQLDVVEVDDAAAFVATYDGNLQLQGQLNTEEFDVFPSLHAACRLRDCGVILAANDKSGQTAAMAFFVWDMEAMYYLLSTRAPTAHSGAVSLLIWEGVRRAHALGVALDLDGVSSAGRARFLAGFGGVQCSRLVVHKVRPLYRLLRAAKECVTPAATTNRYD